MSTIRGTPPTARWKQALLALESQNVSAVSFKFFNSHRDTEDLRYVAERYKRRHRGHAESSVLFELDRESGRIWVSIEDDVTGAFKLLLSPEEVERVLQRLEQTEDNDSTLSSFFIDLQV
jgi:hypothetical protein